MHSSEKKEVEQLTVSADESVCLCSGKHVPRPHILHRHHIIPISFGGDNARENLIDLCPTTHENVHNLLRQYKKFNGRPPGRVRKHYSDFVQRLAQEAWNGKPR